MNGSITTTHAVVVNVNVFLNFLILLVISILHCHANTV